jgi:hypothetical protein
LGAKVPRIWDWIVAITMIVLGLTCGAIIAGLLTFPLVWGLNGLGLAGRWVDWTAFGFVFVLLNAVGFVDYYWLRRVTKAGEAGVFHFVPRAIERIRSGHELGVSAETGMPVDLQAPVRARARLVSGLAVVGLGVLAFFLGATYSRNEWAMVLVALSLIAFVAGVAIVIQAALAYAGFIRRAD